MAPVVGEAEIAEVADTLRSGWLAAGRKAERFEREFAARLGVPAALATSSCTGALHLGLQAVGVARGDEVVVSGYTYTATANAVVQVGAEPVFVDVEADTLNLDVSLVEAALTSRTRAVLAVHFGGHPFDVDALVALCAARGLPLVEDAAHALGALYRGRVPGSYGLAGCFSFYANKLITTGEGGMLVGGDELVERARIMARHGADRSAPGRPVVFPGPEVDDERRRREHRHPPARGAR